MSMQRTRPGSRRQRCALAASITALALTLGGNARAQLAPGNYHQTVGAGAGLAGQVSPTGGFAASVPLDLPAPRGALPVPLSVNYTGLVRAGVAGVGWDVPISYVAWQRPEHTRPSASSASGQRPPRLMLAMDGSPQRMLQLDDAGTRFAPFLSTRYQELRKDGDTWRLKTLDNLEYVFTHLPGASADTPWLLTEVRDLIGTDRVVIEYDTAGIGSCGRDLHPRRYSYGWSAAGVPLYQIELAYEGWWRPTGELDGPSCGSRTTAGVGEQAVVFDLGTDLLLNSTPNWRERSSILTSISILARNNLDAASSPRVVKRYQLTYQPDRTTAKPRLTAVNQQGENGTGSMPVALYYYGALQTVDDPVTNTRSLNWTVPVAVPRSAALPAAYVDDLSESAESESSDSESHTDTTKLRHTIRDFTGDGIPDELWKDGSTWHLARGVVTAAGPRLDGPESTWTQPAEIDWQNTFRYTDLSDSSSHLNHGIATEAWTQFVDWNGDGRLDVIETRGGSAYRMWKVWINEDDGAGGVQWRATEVDVGPLREYLHDRGMRGYDAPTPVARRISAPRNSTFTCDRKICNCSLGECAYGPGIDPPECSGGRVGECELYVDSLRVLGSDTWTEWELVDYNEDGYPDLVSESLPIAVCVGHDATPVPRDATSPDPSDPNGGNGTTSWVDHCPADAVCNDVVTDNRTETLDFEPCAAETGGPVEASAPVVFLNRLGAFDDLPTSTRWTAPLKAYLSALNRWTETYPDAQPGASTGSRQTHRLADDFSRGTLHTETGWPDIFTTDEHAACSATGTHTVHERQASGTIDLNGDGLADHVSSDAVAWNTGVAWTLGPWSLPAWAPSLSEAVRACGTDRARNVSSLTDLDADGIPDLLSVDAGVLKMSSPASDAGAPFTAGRLVAIGNGYGAVTSIRYANAKIDSTTRHAVPFPEIVVDRVKTDVVDASGPSLAATYYRFGDARFEYDGGSTSWTFAGYRRELTLTGIESIKDGRPNVRGVLVASDFDPAAPAGSAFGEQARRGHLLATSQTAGDFDPTALDPYLLPNSTTPFSAAAFTYGTLERPIASGANVWSFFDCRDQANGAAVWSTIFDCQANGFYYQQTARAWEGAPLPGTDNLYAGSTVTAVDAWGRVLSMRAEGDLRRTDDDTCTTVSYGSGAPFPSVVTSSVTTDCGTRTGTAITLAASRYLYDGLPFGQVSVGRLSSRWVDRYDANGVNLGTYQAGAYLYDEFGEVNVVIASRALGGAATRTTTITRDAFGSTVTSISEAATGVPMALAQKTAASTWASLGTSTTDPSGVTTRVERDSFGRPVRSILEADGQRWTLERLTYDDNPAGRRLVQESFPGSTPLGSEAAASDVQRTTTVFDALARVRFTESELGASYGGRRLVSEFVERDALDRVVFAASPFETSVPFVPDAVARHGVSYVYDERGRLTRAVEAIGKNLTATATDLVAKVYVSTTQYVYGGGELTIRSQGPDDLDPSSTRYGWADESTMTAVGAEVRRVRRDQTGAVKDKVEQTWDRLGRVTETRRYQTPTSAVASTVWTNAYDSIGNLLRATEPGTARDSTYDEFGNQLETAWMDGTTRRVARTSYDGFSRVVARELVSTAAGGAPVTESRDLYHYDLPSGDAAQPAVPAQLLRGRLSWVEHPDVGNVYYGYDALGRGNAEVYQYRDLMGVVTHGSEATIGGRLETIRLTTDATDDKVTYSYDSAGRTRGIATEDEKLFSATDVTALGQYERVEFGNGVVENFKYAPAGRRELQQWSADTRSGTYAYDTQTRDAAGRVISELHTTPGAMTQWNAGYDGMGRLLTRVQTSSLVPQVEMFTYDGLGNIASRTTAVGATFQYTPSTGDADRLCRYAAPNTGTSCQFTYDGAGNVTEDRATGDLRGFVYDAGQRITQITRGATKVALTYGPVGRMKTEVMGPEARTIWTFGDLIERRLRRDGVTQIERAIPGPLGTFVSLRSELDDRGAVAAKESIYRHGDGRANRFFTRADGKVVQEATYGVFGQVTAGGSDGGFTGSDDLWNGGDDLPEVGVTLLGPRAYDPLLGRFLQRDPIAILARSTTANPYAFAFSDPVNYADPTGLTPAGAGGAPACTGSECPGLAMQWSLRLIGMDEVSRSRRSRVPRGIGLGTNRVKVDPKAIISTWRVCDMWCRTGGALGSAADMLADAYGQYRSGEAAGVRGFLTGLKDAVKSIPGCIDPRAGCSINMLTNSVKRPAEIIDELRHCTDNCIEVASKLATEETLNWAMGEGIGKAIGALGKLKTMGGVAGVTKVLDEGSARYAIDDTAPASTPVGRVERGPMEVRTPGTNAPTTIGGRQYTAHALDRMQQRGLVPSVVEDTIHFGDAVPGSKAGTTAHYSRVNQITVITDTPTGRVLTAYPGKGRGF